MFTFKRHTDGLPWLTFGRFFSPEGSGSSGGAGGSGGNSGGGSEGGGSENGDNDSDDSEEEDSEEDEEDKPVYSKKKMTDIVSKRLNKAKTQWERDAQKAKDTEQNNFKGLYETTKNELDEIRPKAELADNLIEQFNRNIEDEIKEWPDEIKDMDPGAEDVKARMAWLPKGRKAVKKFEENKQSKGIDGEHGKQGGNNGEVKLDFVKNKYQGVPIPGQKKD